MVLPVGPVNITNSPLRNPLHILLNIGKLVDWLPSRKFGFATLGMINALSSAKLVYNSLVATRAARSILGIKSWSPVRSASLASFGGLVASNGVTTAHRVAPSLATNLVAASWPDLSASNQR